MKTLATFVPRLAGAGYVTVSTCRLVAEEPDSPRLSRLRDALQSLCNLLAGLKEEADIGVAAAHRVLRAVGELHQAERPYFSPVSVTTVARKHVTEYPLPDWSRLCSVREQLAPLLSALDAEICRLSEEKSLRQAVQVFLRYPRGSFMVEDEEFGTFLFEKERPETGLQPSEQETFAAKLLQRVREAVPTVGGGDGSTPETAIVMKDEGEHVVRDEYTLFRRAFGTSPDHQALLSLNGRHYDVLVKTLEEEPRGRREYTLWFDITAYREHGCC